MAHTIEWLSFPRILHVALYGDLQLEDIENFSDDVIKHLDEGQAPVHIIVSDSEVGRPPINLNKLRQAAKFVQHPSLGWQVGIGSVNPVVHYIAPMMMKIVGVKLVRRDTKEEALAFLQKQDSTLHLQAQ